MTKIGPFEAVTHDYVRDDGYRVLVSGAYNARGLIGPEMNGIAVLDEINQQVVTDCIGRQNSGWYGQEQGPARPLVDLFEILKAAPPAEFARIVNEKGQSRARVEVEDRTEMVVNKFVEALDAAGSGTAVDTLNDALHEAANDADVPEGELRDAWRHDKLEELGLSSGYDLGDTDTVARALVTLGVSLHQVEEVSTFMSPA